MERFSSDSCVRDYHVYNDIWEAIVGGELQCQLKEGHTADPNDMLLGSRTPSAGHSSDEETAILINSR